MIGQAGCAPPGARSRGKNDKTNKTKGRLTVADVQVREAQPSDVDAIRSLVTSLANERGAAPDGEVIASMIGECIDASSHMILVAQVDDRLAGYLAVHWISMPMLPGREGYISDLIIGAEWRGKGIGSSLLEAVEKEAADRGCVRLMLNNRVGRESHQRDFYPKAGFWEHTEFANFAKPV